MEGRAEGEEEVIWIFPREKGRSIQKGEPIMGLGPAPMVEREERIDSAAGRFRSVESSVCWMRRRWVSVEMGRE